MQSRTILVTALLLSAAACAHAPPAEPAQAQLVTSSALAGRDWVLVSIGSENVTIAKPPTLRLDAATVRASGHGGCNRYSASYTLNGDNLTFGPAAATKMFCNEGSAIEQKFFDALTTTTRYELSDSALVLRSSSGEVLRFRPTP